MVNALTLTLEGIRKKNIIKKYNYYIRENCNLIYFKKNDTIYFKSLLNSDTSVFISQEYLTEEACEKHLKKLSHLEIFELKCNGII